MSYNPSQYGPRGPPQQYDHYGIPSYPDQDAYHPQQRPAQPPPQGRRAPQQGYGPDPRMRFPHPQAFPRQAPPPQQIQHLYDGSDYGDDEADQWPLNAAGMAQNRPHLIQQATQRGPPPRPQRPDYVPPSFESPRQPPRVAPANRQYHQPPPQPAQPHHGSGEWTGDGYAMPGPPPTALSQAQIQSLPSQAFDPPRRPPLGPPPSARRGPASYYSQLSNVHPIVEESDSARGSIRGSIRDPSRGSYASSNAIPIGIPDYYLNDRDSGAISMPPTTPGSEYPSDEYSPVESVPPLRPGGFDESREQPRHEHYPPPPQPEDYSQYERPALVRQASMGKRSKPTLTTVKSGDRLRSKSNASNLDGPSGLPNQQNHKPSDVQSPEEIPMVFQTPRTEFSEKDVEAGAPPEYNTPSTAKPPASSFFDSNSEESSVSVPSSHQGRLDVPPVALQQSRTLGRSPLADVHEKEVLGNLERGGAVDHDDYREDTLKPPTAGLAFNRAGKPRPPRLNVDSVRDAEARGSLTSLPDLIKRATRLASNLDRGRTASRLGMSEWLGTDPKANKPRSEYRKSNGSISDILASFPPPGVPTPPGSRSGQRRSRLGGSSRLRHSTLGSDSDAGSTVDRNGTPRKRGRRCCGMPLWLFLLLLALVICLVAAAVVVPVVLVVLPKQNSSSSSSNNVSDAALNQCSAELTCANSGQLVTADDHSCRCVCVNGFTGKTCQTKSSQGCASYAVAGTQSATIGAALPRLLDNAGRNFSIPLDAQVLAGLFSSAELDCAGENALVTFNGQAQKRQAATPTSSSAGVAVTSNGIVFESGSPSHTPSATSSATSSPTAKPSSTPSTSTGLTPEQKSLDFARVAVLYIFQISGQLRTTITAQEKLQQFFDNAGGRRDDVELGSGWVADLESYTLTGNGTVVGGAQ